MLDHVGADLQHIHSCTTKLAGGSSINDRVSGVVKKMFPTVKLHISIWLIPFTDMVWCIFLFLQYIDEIDKVYKNNYENGN